MTSLRSRPWLGLAGLLLVAACGTPTPPSSAPSASASIQPSAGEPTVVPGGSAAASPGTSAGTSAGLPTQTDTAWGRIWDALPPSFPVYPGSIPTETGEGPISASLAVGASAEQAADFLRIALASAGYSIESIEGPSEDGGRTLNAVGPSGDACQVQVRLKPLSGTTLMTVMFGAGCPFA